MMRGNGTAATSPLEQKQVAACKKKFAHGELSRDMAISQLCLIGYSPTRATQVVGQWKWELDNGDSPWVLGAYN